MSYFTGSLAKAFTKLTKIKASVAIYAAQAYDAANAIIKSLDKEMRSSKISTLRKETVAELHKISFTGVTGPISFQKDGNLKIDKGAVAVSEVENGTITFLTTVG